MGIRFGLNALVYTASFTGREAGLVEKIAAMGYDGIEVLFGDLDALDPSVRAAAGGRLRRMIDRASEMGAQGIAGPLHAPVRWLTGRARTADEWGWCRDALGAAAHAERAGLFMAIEPLNRFETYVVNTIGDAVALCREVDSQALGAQVDAFHANVEEKDTGAAIRAAGQWVRHVHASENDRGVPGTGQADWDGALAVLAGIGYGAWVMIESFATGIVDLCAAACVWRPLYYTADALARDGLEFLRRMAAKHHLATEVSQA